MATYYSKRRALIIDDDPVFARALSKMIGGLEYDVTILTDPLTSFTFSLKESDMIFLDVVMPNDWALAILKRMALLESGSRLILMSGSLERLDEAENMARQLNLNLMGVLDKPFRLEDVKLMLTMAKAKPLCALWN